VLYIHNAIGSYLNTKKNYLKINNINGGKRWPAIVVHWNFAIVLLEELCRLLTIINHH
jgi:hypothetical protein